MPTDNPFVSRAGARPEIWSYGHRNVQGLAIHPETGDLWADEHGPQGGDELNRIQPGKNYGWPVIGFGVNYTTGLAIHAGTHRDGMEQPVRIWVPSIGISGMMFYTGDKFPQWRGNMFVGGMDGQQLSRLTLNGQRIVNEETLVQQMGPHPRHPAGPGRLHLPGHRRSRRQAHAGLPAGARPAQPQGPSHQRAVDAERRFTPARRAHTSSRRLCFIIQRTCQYARIRDRCASSSSCRP